MGKLHANIYANVLLKIIHVMRFVISLVSLFLLNVSWWWPSIFDVVDDGFDVLAKLKSNQSNKNFDFFFFFLDNSNKNFVIETNNHA